MSNISSQTQSNPAPLPEESSDKAQPRPEANKWRVGNLLHAFAPKKKTPDQPSATQEGPVRPVIGPDKAALFLDSKGRIVSAQPRCADFFGRQPDELSGLNMKELLKSGFDQQVANVLAKKHDQSEQSFHVLALRKDGSEFATQLEFKFLPGNLGFCWTVLVQAPPGYSDEKSSKGQNGSQTPPGRDVKPTAPTTETATQGQTPQSGSGAKTPAPASRPPSQAARSEDVRLARMRFDADRRLRQVQKDYGNRLIQLESDLAAERELSEKLSKKLEALQKPSTEPQAQPQTGQSTAAPEKSSNESQTLRAQAEQSEARQLAAALEKEREANKLARQKSDELNARIQNLQKASDQAEARVRESTAKCTDWEGKVAALTKSADELTRSKAAGQSAGAQSAQRARELEQQLKQANQKAEELNTQLQKLQKASDQAEARLRESAAQSSDWEKKAANLKKDVDELTASHAAEKNAVGQYARRVKDFEQQLKDANTSLAAGKTDAEKQKSARQRLESENHNLTEAGAKAKADLDKEREAVRLSRKKEEELSAQLQKSQKAAEQAEARVRESAAQSRDWEKKAAELKKNVDDLTRSHAAEKNAAAQSAQRVKELEQQLKRAGDDLAAGKAEVEKQNSAYQRLEAEIRNLTDAHTRAKADLTGSAEKQAVLEKKAAELEQRVRQGVFSLAKVNADLQSERAERERAEKNASSAAAQVEKLKEKLKRQMDLERAGQDKIAELEKTIRDRGDDLARAAAALRKEAKERQVAQKQSRLVSEMGTRLETNLASLDEAKKTFGISLKQKDEQLQLAEHSLAQANSSLEKESTERRRLEELLTDAKQQLEKLSAESKVEISRLQAAVDLGELQRKRLEGDLLRSRDGGENAEQKSAKG